MKTLRLCSMNVKGFADVRPVVCHPGAVPKSLPLLDVSDVLCCAPIAAGDVGPDHALAVALRLKALADPARIRLMSMVLSRADTGVCTCDLAPAVELSEATVSHHLRVLREAGLVVGTRRGTNTWYRPRTDALAALAQVLDPTCC